MDVSHHQPAQKQLPVWETHSAHRGIVSSKHPVISLRAFRGGGGLTAVCCFTLGCSLTGINWEHTAAAVQGRRKPPAAPHQSVRWTKPSAVTMPLTHSLLWQVLEWPAPLRKGLGQIEGPSINSIAMDPGLHFLVALSDKNLVTVWKRDESS